MFSATDRKYFKQHAKTLIQFIPFLVVGLFVPVVLILFKVVDQGWFILGPVTWFVALALKSTPVLIGMWYFPSVKISNIYLRSVFEGVLSAVTELGLTVVFFLYYIDELSIRRIFSFGLGIGFIEVLFILYLLIEDIEKLTSEVKTKKGFVLWPQLIERIFTIGLHVFSRTIIGLSLMLQKRYTFILLAFLIFAFMDGFGAYIVAKWDLTKRTSLIRVYGLLLLFVLVLAYICFTYYL